MYPSKVGGDSLLLSFQPHAGALYRFFQTLNPRQHHCEYCRLADKDRKMKGRLKKVTGHPKSRATKQADGDQSLVFELRKLCCKGQSPLTRTDGGLKMPRERYGWRELIPGESVRFAYKVPESTCSLRTQEPSPRIITLPYSYWWVQG